jgi:DNA-binding LacI/PurR family transcriptional regulator
MESKKKKEISEYRKLVCAVTSTTTRTISASIGSLSNESSSSSLLHIERTLFKKEYSIFVMNYSEDKYVFYNNWEIDHV